MFEAAPNDIEFEEIADPLAGLAERAATDPGAPFEPAMLQALAALRGADLPAFRRLRAALKRAGVGVTALDDALRASEQPNDGPKLAGRPVEFVEIEPWPDPVRCAEVLDEAAAFATRHSILPDGGAVALALWAAHTWAFDAFPVTPRLAITSPEKRCGKTLALRIAASLSARALDTANVSAAAVFRVIEQASPSLFIDEADTFLAEREELRGVLNAGYSRGGQVIRCVGEDSEARAFAVFAPVAVAAIGRLPDTLMDRSIVLAMRRRAANETVERLSARNDPAAPIRAKLTRLALDRAESWGAADPPTPAHLDDRAADNWRVLLAIADDAGPAWGERARAACFALTGGRSEDDDTTRTALLRDVREAFRTENDPDKISSARLCELLADDESSPWAAFGRSEKPIQPAALARLLKPFKIRPKVIRAGAHLWRGYTLEAFADAWRRYLPPEAECEGVTLQQSLSHKEISPADPRNAEKAVAFAETQKTQAPQGLLRRNGSAPPAEEKKEAEGEMAELRL